MSRATALLLGGVLVLAGLLAFSYIRSNRFEQKARDAERFALAQRNANKILNDELREASKRIGKRDTVLVHDRRNIVVTDLRNPPPASCAPNLAARDKVIAHQQDQILDLDIALDRARRMLANSDAARDTLAAALRARPKPLLNLGFLELGMPKLGVFAGACTNGLCAGAGVTLSVRIGGK